MSTPTLHRPASRRQAPPPKTLGRKYATIGAIAAPILIVAGTLFAASITDRMDLGIFLVFLGTPIYSTIGGAIGYAIGNGKIAHPPSKDAPPKNLIVEAVKGSLFGAAAGLGLFLILMPFLAYHPDANDLGLFFHPRTYIIAGAVAGALWKSDKAQKAHMN